MTAILTSNFTTIEVGQSITFNVVIPAADIPNQTPTGGDQELFGFAGGYALFSSGDGQTQQNYLLQAGGGNVTFTYQAPGNYVASAMGAVSYHTVICGEGYSGCEAFMNSGAFWDGIDVFENITVVPDPPGFVPFSASVVPEPATWVLMLLGFGFLMWRSRRRKLPPPEYPNRNRYDLHR